MGCIYLDVKQEGKNPFFFFLNHRLHPNVYMGLLAGKKKKILWGKKSLGFYLLVHIAGVLRDLRDLF